MQPAGVETLARWREAGEWWDGQPAREVHRYLDGKGNRREKVRTIGEAITSSLDVPAIRNVRDEKVARACGYAIDPDLSTLADYPEVQQYATLHALSGYAYGRATLFASEIGAYARVKGIGAALLADPFSLTGAVEFWKTATKVGVQPLIGASLELPEGGELVLVARNKNGYRSLSRLITSCHLHEPRLYPLASWERLEQHTEGLLCLTGGDGGPLNRKIVRGEDKGAIALLDRLVGLYGREDVFVQIERTYLPWQLSVNRHLLELAEVHRLTPVAGGPVTHLAPDYFPAQDMVVCIETLCLIDEIEGRKPPRDAAQPPVLGVPRRGLNAERYLRTPKEMREIFADRPDLVANTWRVAERCEVDILPGRSLLPIVCADEPGALREAAWAGARERYPLLHVDLRRRIDRELDRITRLGFESHFLVAWDMCTWARQHGVLFSGRGSVVDSVVAYCLGLSRIDAYEHKLHFDRFLPNDATKRPDIDIDFEARRRDDVRDYLVSRYGAAHVATVAAVGTYRSRGIVREVGKVLGIPEESLGYLAKRLHGSVSPDHLEQAIDAKPELRNSGIPRERFRWVFRLARDLMDLPRNIRTHSSGVVVSRDPISDYVPVMRSAVDGVDIIQWDKRSAKRCFDKFDVLCLRGNDVLSDTQTRVRWQDPDFDVEDISLQDPETYRTMRTGQLIGVPQSASPAMRQAHIRIRTQNLTDASLVQAGIRPGVGGAVKINELIARRRGKPYKLCHPNLETILGHTYGIIVFQEQVDQLLQTFGGYTSDEAEEIREGIHKRRREDFAENIRGQVTARIQSNGYSQQVAVEVCDLVAGFQGYGFAQGHALAFAEISVRSVWCQQHYPAEYFAALLDAQPAGYYGPTTIANEARVRGVKILPPSVNRSDLMFTVEDVLSTQDPKITVPSGGIRVALRQISGVSEGMRESIVRNRLDGSYTSFFDFVARVRPPRDELERMILCGALDELSSNRRATLWAIPSAYDYAGAVGGLAGALPLQLHEPDLPDGVSDFSAAEKAVQERAILDLDVERHLVAYERERIRSRGGITCDAAMRLPHGEKVFVVGNPIRLRFPPTVSGKRVLFFDLEDETGLLNVTCFNDVYERDGHAVVCSSYVTLRGMAQHRDGHIAFLAHRIFPYQPVLGEIVPEDMELPITTADFLMG